VHARTHPAPAATVEPIRSARKALVDLVEAGRLDEAQPLARFVLKEVAALERGGFTRPVRAGDLDLCRRILEGRQAMRPGVSPVAPVEEPARRRSFRA
jgi:hypothetical protein